MQSMDERLNLTNCDSDFCLKLAKGRAANGIAHGVRWADMIFRYLYRRKVFGAFGRFLNKEQLEALVAPPMTEWQALKSFLPRRWFYSADQERAALSEVARLAAYYARSHQDDPSQENRS